MAWLGSMDVRLGGRWCLAHSGGGLATKGSAPTGNQSTSQQSNKDNCKEKLLQLHMEQARSRGSGGLLFSPVKEPCQLSHFSHCVSLTSHTVCPQGHEPSARTDCAVSFLDSRDLLLDIKTAALSVSF